MAASAIYMFNSTELDSLMSVRNDCDWRVYMSLRKSADFKTGKLEHRSALQITTGKIAREISLPAANGSAPIIFERWDVLNSIERLIKAGLIDCFEKVGHYLRLRLPLLIQASKDTAERCARSEAEKQPRSARMLKTHQTLVADASSMVEIKRCARSEAENDPWSSLKESELPSGTVVTQRFQASEQTAFSTINPRSTITPPKTQDENPRGETPLPSASKTQIQTRSAATQLAENPEESAQIDCYRDIVHEEGAGIIRYLDTAISRGIYLSWAKLKTDLRDVREAVRTVLKSAHLLQTPGSIDIVLRRAVAAAIKSADCKMRGTGRGFLAL